MDVQQGRLPLTQRKVGWQRPSLGIVDVQLVVEQHYHPGGVPQPQRLPRGLQIGRQATVQSKGQLYLGAIAAGRRRGQRQPVLDAVRAVLVPLGQGIVPAVLDPRLVRAQLDRRVVANGRQPKLPGDPATGDDRAIGLITGGKEAVRGEGDGEALGPVRGAIGPLAVPRLPGDLVLGRSHHLSHGGPVGGGEAVG